MLTTGGITKDEKEIWQLFERGYQVKPYLNSGVLEETSGWADITAQIEKANRKVKKKHGKVF